MSNKTRWKRDWQLVAGSIGVLTLVACGGSGNSGNGAKIQFTASGEVLALNGYTYPQTDPRAAAFVDGWDVKLTKLLVTIDKITLWTNPDTAPYDQSSEGQKVTNPELP